MPTIHKRDKKRLLRGPGRRVGRVATCGPRASRRGAVMIVAIICLSLIILLLGTLLRMAVTLRRQAHFEQNRHQAECLAESGVERAAHHLMLDADYRGETWRLAADEIGGKHPGQVTIEVDAAAADTARRRVTVVATYPAEGRTFARNTKQVLVAVGVPP